MPKLNPKKDCTCSGKCSCTGHADALDVYGEEPPQGSANDAGQPITDKFESKAQQGFLEVHHPEIAKEFAEKTTDYKDLPEHVEAKQDGASRKREAWLKEKHPEVWKELDALDAHVDEGEILAPLSSHIESVPVDHITLSPEFPIHEGQEKDNEPQEELPPETFDVDKKLFLTFREVEGKDILFDGHHHFAKAAVATHFVSSKIQEGRLVAVAPLLICRVFCESDGWTRDMIRVLSQRANFEGKKAIAIDPTEVTEEGLGDDAEVAALIDSGEVFAFTDTCESEYEAITDGLRDGVLGVLSQKITRVNTPTKWGFTYQYPGPAGAAIDEANKRFRFRSMHTERNHPQLIPEACDDNGCGPKFVSNFDHITGTPLTVGVPDSDGWVTGRREVLDTPHGREVWAAAQRGEPIPVSVRWLCDREARTTGKPKWLRLITWDDVRSPAVVGAGAIADSHEPMPDGNDMTSWANQGKDGYGMPFLGINNNMVNPYPRDDKDETIEEIARGDSVPGAKAQQSTMKTHTDILKDIRAFRSLVRTKGAKRGDIQAADLSAANAILDHYGEGQPVKELVESYRSAFADDAEGPNGYHSDMSAPYIHLAGLLGDDPYSGWAPDMKKVPDGPAGNGGQMSSDKPKPIGTGDIKAGGMADSGKDEDDEDEEEDKEKKKMKKEMDAKMDSYVLQGHPFGRLPDRTQKIIRKHVFQSAKAVDEVGAILDGQVRLAGGSQAFDRLANLGYVGHQTLGRTINDKSPMATFVNESEPGEAAFQKLMAANDDWMAMGNTSAEMGVVNPNSPGIQKRREANRKKIAPLIDDILSQTANAVGKDKFWGALTDSKDENESIERQVKAIAQTDSYTTSVANLPNQPTIVKFILTQQFQDLPGLLLFDPIGPGFDSPGNAVWEMREGIGRVFRVFYESVINGSGWGFQFNNIDFGLKTPQNQGISEMSVQGIWQTFAPSWRKNAVSATIESIKAIGNGPLNYSAMARNLWHCSARKSRAVNTDMINEIPQVSLEYGAVAITNESYTGSNSGLANQSVFQNGSTTVPGATSTSTVVNLNPQKQAQAAVVLGSDDYIIYPNPFIPTSGQGQAPIGAMRLQGGTAVGTNSGTLFGLNGFTKSPIVVPRDQPNINAAGQDTDSVQNPIAISAPSAMVLGLLGNDGYIYSYPGTTATYAIDYPNGCAVFCAGVTGSTVITTNITFASYSYATNYDSFPITPGINGMANLATGETQLEFFNRLLYQFDKTSGTMASPSRFVAPDHAIMSANVSPVVLDATAFYKLNSPKQTELYPDEDFFATHNGVNMMRTNVPWMPGDNFITLFRKGAFKYVMDTPWALQGPAVKYDSSGNLIAGEAFAGWENSAICTVQVQDGNANIINPVTRTIQLIQGGTPI